MSRYLLFTIIILNAFTGLSQTNTGFSLQINYGLTGNFFVRSYDEAYSPWYYHKYFYKKNFIGTVGGVYADYHISPRSFFLAEYSRSVNTGRKNYDVDTNGTEIYIKDFRIRYINNSFYLGYGYDTKIKSFSLKPDIGFVIVYNSDQDMIMEGFNSIWLNESNPKNANSVEGGVFLGLSCTKKIDTKFDIGLKARVCYLISINYLEFVNLTPTLTYHFLKKPKKESFHAP